MIDKQIDEKFFRVYFSDKVVGAIDFDTLLHHDVQFLDSDYQQFIYGMLWSANVEKKKTYFYVVLRIGDELSDVFFKSIVREIILDKIIAWHKEEFPQEPQNPAVEYMVLRCDRKKQA